jgi:hypothetical protein
LGGFILSLEDTSLKLKFAPHFDREAPIELPICEPLLVRLIENVGPLPSGFIYNLPRFEAEKLIRRKKATAVGMLGVMPDLTLTEDEVAEAGI